MATIAATETSPFLPSMHHISLKLDRSNYSFWKAQVQATARAYGFDDILFQSSSPVQFSNDSTTVNPAYLTWLKRDQFLFSWLLSSISPPMLSYIGRCSTAAQIWKVFETNFHSQSKARAMHLRQQLQQLKKGAAYVDDYMLKFRELSDQLYNIGQSIPESDLISYVLQGLGSEYESVCVLLASKCEELSLHEVQFALHTHELRLHAQSTISNTVSMAFQPQANIAYQPHMDSFGRGRGRSGGKYCTIS